MMEPIDRDRSPPPGTRLAGAAGPFGAILAVVSIFAATLLSSTFSWSESALSDLGVAADPLVVLLFNGGLVAGGIVGIGYALALGRHSTGVAVAYALSVLAMILVGLFPAGTAPHLPVAVAFFLLATATVALDGWHRRSSTAGRVALALAAGHLLGWATWGVGLRPGPGLALPELGGVAMFGGWILFLAPASRWVR
mgnify:CR=1 FL=1